MLLHGHVCGSTCPSLLPLPPAPPSYPSPSSLLAMNETQAPSELTVYDNLIAFLKAPVPRQLASERRSVSASRCFSVPAVCIPVRVRAHKGPEVFVACDYEPSFSYCTFMHTPTFLSTNLIPSPPPSSPSLLSPPPPHPPRSMIPLTMKSVADVCSSLYHPLTRSSLFLEGFMLLDGKLEEEAQKVGSVVSPVSEISLLHVVLLSKSALMSYTLCSTGTAPTSIGACHLVHLPAAVLH